MYTKYTSDLKESEGDLEENQLVTPQKRKIFDYLNSKDAKKNRNLN